MIVVSLQGDSLYIKGRSFTQKRPRARKWNNENRDVYVYVLIDIAGDKQPLNVTWLRLLLV